MDGTSQKELSGTALKRFALRIALCRGSVVDLASLHEDAAHMLVAVVFTLFIDRARRQPQVPKGDLEIVMQEFRRQFGRMP